MFSSSFSRQLFSSGCMRWIKAPFDLCFIEYFEHKSLKFCLAWFWQTHVLDPSIISNVNNTFFCTELFCSLLFYFYTAAAYFDEAVLISFVSGIAQRTAVAIVCLVTLLSIDKPAFVFLPVIPSLRVLSHSRYTSSPLLQYRCAGAKGYLGA